MSTLEVDTDFADLFEVKDGVVAERDDQLRTTTTHADAWPTSATTSTAR